MLQKSLRGLTPTTFWLTPEALTATLLLKMNREVLDVAHMDLYGKIEGFPFQDYLKPI